MNVKQLFTGIIFSLAFLTMHTGMGQTMVKENPTDPGYDMKSLKIIPFEIIDSLIAPGGDCNDICWDGDNLWVTDGLSRKIYMMDDSAGTVVKSFPFPATNLWCEGLTFDGTFLWACTWDVPNGEGSRLYKIDRSSGGINAQVDYTDDYYGNFPHGMTYKGSSIWASNAKTMTLDEIEPQTGKLLGTLPSTAGTIGIAYYNAAFWTTDVDNSRINKIDQYTGEILGYIPMPVANCRGLDWEDDYLWTVAHDKQTIYKISVGALNVDEISKDELRVYPNPSQGTFTFLLDKNISTSFTLDVYDVSGKKVYSHEYPSPESSEEK